MIRTAFSSLACPDWTLDRVAHAAATWGFQGVELRSLGSGAGAAAVASDPALTDPSKVRRTIDEAGIELVSIASGCRFDAPIFPPVLGHVLPSRHAPVREARRAVELARDCGAPFVRVFGFEIPPRERRASAINRIVLRLREVCDHARNRNVIVLLENDGSFSAASDLLEVIAQVDHPLLGACYDLSAAARVGEDPIAGAAALGPLLKAARVRDVRAGRPCPPGEGDLPCAAFVRAVSAGATELGTQPWVIMTWDRAWLRDLAPAEDVLPRAAERLAEWGGASTARRPLGARRAAALSA